MAAIFFFVGWVFLPVISTQASESLTLSVTPPLFQITVKPGEEWVGLLKVVNVNPYDLTVYAVVTGFRGADEEGHGAFVPLQESEKDGSFNLAQWIEVQKELIVIARESSVQIPITLRVPPNAEPGGYYAAVLVGTQPGEEASRGAVIRVSSFVSSIVFVRIVGKVKESGLIRDFFVNKRLFSAPETELTLRFENTGNVHLQPRGEIAIYNMRGRLRGKLTVNDSGEFGNVLPASVRKFTYIWKGDLEMLDFGRFRAVATLNFGNNEKQNVFAETYFWIVPIKPLLGMAGGLFTLVLLASLSIRLYVKRMLALYIIPKQINQETDKQRNLEVISFLVSKFFDLPVFKFLYLGFRRIMAQLKLFVRGLIFEKAIGDNPLSDIRKLEEMLENYVEKNQERERDQLKLIF